MDLTFRASQIKHCKPTLHSCADPANAYSGGGAMLSGWHRNAENGKKGFEDDLMHKFSGIAESYGIALDDDAFAA